MFNKNFYKFLLNFVAVVSVTLFVILMIGMSGGA